MNYEPTKEALDAAMLIVWEDKIDASTDENEYNRFKLFVEEAVKAAIAIDRKVIALDFIRDQWVSFEDKESLINGDLCLVQNTENGKLMEELAMFVNNEMFYAFGGVNTTWLRALPIKALGV